MFKLGEIAGIVRGDLKGNPERQVFGISTDSRSIGQNELYLALKGERFDGHDFIKGLEGNYPVIHQEGEVLAPSIKVPDTLVAYGAIAGAKRKNWGGMVVAVTGSSGKTSTKEAIAHLLEGFAPTHRTLANHNNEIGLPKTLLSLAPHHRYAVVEMGMRARGEISTLAKIAKPDIGVITNIGKAHIGRLGSQEAIQKAKGELFAEIRSTGGTMIANGDDELARALIEGYEKAFTFGFGENCNIRGERLDSSSFRVLGCVVHLAQPGEHHAYNALAAIAVAHALNLSLPPEIEFAPQNLPGRAQKVSLEKDLTLWDETYNANPESMRAAIKSLFEQPGRHVLALGEMGELGEHAEGEHLELGRFLKSFPVDLLVTLGPLAGLIGKTAGCPHENFDTREEAAKHLVERIDKGCHVLFKGSRSTKMEETLFFVQKALEGSEP